MNDELTPFPELAEQFAKAVEAGKKTAATLPFVTLQYKALMEHKAESDEDKKLLTAQAAGLAAHWLAKTSRADFHGNFQRSTELIGPLLDALELPGSIPFVPIQEAAKAAEACVAFAYNGPSLLAKAAAATEGNSDDSLARREENRTSLLALTQRSLDFADRCKQFRENLNLDSKTSKDIAPAKRITLKAPEATSA
jgi:hypothetical protein